MFAPYLKIFIGVINVFSEKECPTFGFMCTA